MPLKQPYNGSQAKLCLAFDVGTTYSGVSYCVLRPGEVPSIFSVARYPGLKHRATGCKIPSVLYYDRSGNLRAVGAMTSCLDTIKQAEEEGWIKVSWFKLLFTPNTAAFKDIRRYKAHIAALPSGKSRCDVLADYLRYLNDSAKSYVYASHPDGVLLWDLLQDTIEFVLSHPNGWGGMQQKEMMLSMILAGLIPDTSEGRDRVMFVSEGEASLHYCLNKQRDTSWDGIQEGHTAIIVDAGGGTVDVSAYNILSVAPPSVQELNVPESLLQGSQFVTFRMESFLRDSVKVSRSGSIIRKVSDAFEETIKPIFKDDSETYRIPVDSHLSSARTIDLSGSQVARFFEPTFSAIVECIRRQRQGFSFKIRTVLLLGGFAANPWLSNKLEDRLRLMHIRLDVPDVPSNRAVAEGSVSVYIHNCVRFRISKFVYGVECTREFENNNPEHQRRSSSAIINPSGKVVLPNAYQTVLKKGVKVAEDHEFSWPFRYESNKADELNFISCDIICYTGSAVDPQWIDIEPDKFKKLCTIQADVSGVPKQPRQLPADHLHRADLDEIYFRQRFRVVLLFGMTELKAQIRWYDDEEKSSAACLIYDEEID